MSATKVAHLNLYLEAGGRVGRVMWIRPVLGTPDIVEASLEFEGPYGCGYQTWFFLQSAEGMKPVSCSMYLDVDTMAIRLREAAAKSGRSLAQILPKGEGG